MALKGERFKGILQSGVLQAIAEAKVSSLFLFHTKQKVPWGDLDENISVPVHISLNKLESLWVGTNHLDWVKSDANKIGNLEV